MVAVALERYFNICKPFTRNLVSTKQVLVSMQINNFLQGSVFDGFGYIFAIILFSILYNLIKFFEFKTVYVDMEDPNTNEMSAPISTMIKYNQLRFPVSLLLR